MTDPEILAKSVRVRDTWAKNCDVTLFMSSEPDPKFPTVGLGVPAGRSHIAAKSRAAWTHIYRHYRDQADFFMKADPDSYVSVPNLKLFLASQDPDKPEFYGHALYYGRDGWMGNFSGFYSAGQSVVLTRNSLIRLAAGGISEKCFFDGQAEDLKTAVCLSHKGGHIVDTRDVGGRETFVPAIGLSNLMAGLLPAWYTKHYRKYLGYCKEMECLSNFPIVLHYIGMEMYIIKYLERGNENSNAMRRQYVMDAYDGGFLKFNGSILAELYKRNEG